MLIYFAQVITDGDDRRFISDVFIAYERLVYHELRKYVDNAWELEDLFQSVFEKLINKIPTLRTLDKPRLTRYIVVTAKNTAISYLHKSKKFEFVPYDELILQSTPIDSSVEDLIIDKDQIGRVRAAWATLDQQTQYYLDAKYTLEKSATEIATDLGIPAVNVRMALSRARNKLKKLL